MKRQKTFHEKRLEKLIDNALQSMIKKDFEKAFDLLQEFSFKKFIKQKK